MTRRPAAAASLVRLAGPSAVGTRRGSYVDVPRALAETGQVLRGRVVDPVSFAGHWARWEACGPSRSGLRASWTTPVVGGRIHRPRRGRRTSCVGPWSPRHGRQTWRGGFLPAFVRTGWAQPNRRRRRSRGMAANDDFPAGRDADPYPVVQVIPTCPLPPPPPLHPGTRQPVGPDDLAPLFPMALIEPEVTTAPYVEIPGGVLDVYRLWRPSPLVRARRLERWLDTRPRSSSSTRGSARPARTSRTRPFRSLLQPRRGVHRLTTETGAGQWGTALAFATRSNGMECEIWQVRSSYDQKPARRTMMQATAPRCTRAHQT